MLRPLLVDKSMDVFVIINPARIKSRIKHISRQNPRDVCPVRCLEIAVDDVDDNHAYRFKLITEFENDGRSFFLRNIPVIIGTR